jgi:hypothetical protein
VSALAELEGEPWEKLPGETLKQYHAFTVFRDLGYRGTVAQAAEKLGVTKSNLDKWSGKNFWQERRNAWWLHLEALGRQAQEQSVEEMNRRHLEIAEQASQVLLRRIRGGGTVTVRDREGEPHEIELPPLSPIEIEGRDVPRYMESIQKMERLARGQPTDFFKGAVLVHPVQVQKAVGLVTDLALERTRDLIVELIERAAAGQDLDPDEEHDAFAESFLREAATLSLSR